MRGRLHPALPMEGATQAPMIDPGRRLRGKMRAMRAIFYLILIISAYLFIKSLLEPRPRSSADKIRSRTRAADTGSDMVQDLYCNTFIPK
ncbi:MAG: hypothetical protein AABZ05_04465, partial [Nitrospirota bacterium]